MGALEYNGSREAFAAALLDLAEKDERIALISPDSLKAMRALPFEKQFPERYIECGIAEQGAVDVAAGMASCGMLPFVGTYCGFLTMRACEQMRTFVGYPNLNVKFFGANAGVFGGEREGVTHQFYEDLAIVSSFPNFTIFTPADSAQCYHAVLAAAETEGPVYIRGCSGREPEVYDRNAPFSKDGITVWRRYGRDALLLSNGFILDRVLAAADLLHEWNVNVTAADINILYGKNNAEVIKEIGNSKIVFTIEDHNINGGLGSYISRLSTEYAPRRVIRFALEDYGESGAADMLADRYGFNSHEMALRIKHALQ